jgi:hypothetical protein
MKRLHMNLNQFAASPIIMSHHATAHSGPELVSSVPHSREAGELASMLLMDAIEVVQTAQHSHAHGAETMIALSRR